MARKTTKTAAKTAKTAKAAGARAAKSAKGAGAKAASAASRASKTLRTSASAAMKNVSKLNAKVIDHAEANAKEAFSAMREVAAADSVRDVIKIQTQFVREQGARSAKQVREIGELIASFGRDAIEAMRGK